jgi:hypothetical protein
MVGEQNIYEKRKDRNPGPKRKALSKTASSTVCSKGGPKAIHSRPLVRTAQFSGDDEQTLCHF